jgi:hypothetical protein
MIHNQLKMPQPILLDHEQLLAQPKSSANSDPAPKPDLYLVADGKAHAPGQIGRHKLTAGHPTGMSIATARRRKIEFALDAHGDLCGADPDPCQ